jgi:hypothetical protein
VQEGDRFAHVRGRAVVEAHLHAHVVPALRLDHLPPFPDVVGRRLLDVDVLAGLAGQDGGQRVPVVGRDDRHGVDGLVVEHTVQVPLRAWCHARLLLDEAHAACEQALVGVAERPHLHVVAVLQGTPVVQVHGALVADANHGDVDAVVGALDLRIRLGAHAHGADGEAGRADQALFDEVAAVARLHGRSPGGGEPGSSIGNAPSIDGLSGEGDRQTISATDSWSAA